MTASREAPVEEKIESTHLPDIDNIVDNSDQIDLSASKANSDSLVISICKSNTDSLVLSVCKSNTDSGVLSVAEAVSPVKVRPTLDSPLVDIKPPLLPVENKRGLLIKDPLPKNTFHQIYHAEEKSEAEVRKYFFKVNAHSTKANAAYISELEAVCAAYYKLLSPAHVADTYAIYDKNNYIGVASEEILNFKSIAHDPVKETDLQVNYIAEKNRFTLFDNFDDEIKLYEKKLEALQRRLNRQKEYEIEYSDKLKDLQANAANSAGVQIDSLLAKILNCSELKNKIHLEMGEVTKKLIEIYQKYYREDHVTEEELNKYRVVKGLAVGLTTSYIFEEDDLHQNNISKYGQRIDFDMSLWPIFYDFKDNGYVDLAFRKPAKGAFKISGQDISRFPNITDAKPFYWPTNPSQMLSETTSSILKNIVSMSTNAYSSQLNRLFQKLEHNQVFEYHKYVTLLKFILPDSTIFRNIASLHLREDAFFQGKPLIDVLTQAIAERQQNFKDTLVLLPQFVDFIQLHGNVVCEQIMIEFKQRNAFYQQKQLQITATLTNLQSEISNYEETNAALTIKLEQLSKIILELTHSVTGYAHKENSVSDSQMDFKTQTLKQKLDERNGKQAMLKENQKKLNKIKLLILKNKAAIKAYSQQEIDLDSVQTTYENICRRLENLPRPATEVAMTRTTSESQPNAVKLHKLHQTHRNGVEMFYNELKRGNSFGRNARVDYKVAKEKLVAAMDLYINPGFFGFGGFFRHQSGLATDLMNYAKNLQPATQDPMSQLKAVLDLKSRLEKELQQLSSGGMYDVITKLLKDDIWKLPDPELMHSPTLTTSTSASKG